MFIFLKTTSFFITMIILLCFFQSDLLFILNPELAINSIILTLILIVSHYYFQSNLKSDFKMDNQLKKNTFIFYNFYISNFKRLLLKYKLVRKYYLLCLIHNLFTIALKNLNSYKLILESNFKKSIIESFKLRLNFIEKSLMNTNYFELSYKYFQSLILSIFLKNNYLN